MNRIAIVGQQCAGKTTAANIIAGHFDEVEFVKFADPIYQVLGVLRQDKHRAFMQDFGEMAKKYFGESIFVDLFHARMWCKNGNSAIICDDIRRLYEFHEAKAQGFKMIYIGANKFIRRLRAEAQGLDFIENHISETEVPRMAPMADVMIINDHEGEVGLRSLRAKIDRAFLCLN